MRIVVVGASKFGVATVETLIEEGHEVVLVDRNRAQLDRLAKRFDCGMIEGDGTSPSVLRDAVNGKNDVLITLTNASDDNILAALVGRSVGFGRVIPQIIETDLLELCAELGLDDTIMPHVTVARSLCKALEDKTEVAEELTLSNELRLKRVEVGEGADGKKLSDIELPKGVRVVALIDEEHEQLPDEDTALAAGNQVLCVVEKDNRDKLAAAFE
jgi:trk system potassium uptake protein TrkA